jgi:hypothetical protein
VISQNSTSALAEELLGACARIRSSKEHLHRRFALDAGAELVALIVAPHRCGDGLGLPPQVRAPQTKQGVVGVEKFERVALARTRAALVTVTRELQELLKCIGHHREGDALIAGE